MKKLKVHFLRCDTNPNLPNYYENNIFLYLLRKRYDIEIVNENPDLLIYTLSHNGHESFKDCVKIFHTEEPGFWDKNTYYNYYRPSDGGYKERFRRSIEDADIIMSSYHIEHESHVRFPSYLLYYYQMFIDNRIPSFDYFFNHRHIVNDNLFNRKFCAYIHRHNREDLFRIKFLKKLNKYKNVDIISIPGASYEKTEHVKANYKFCFGMENTNGDLCFGEPEDVKYPNIGYTTEKIIEPFCSNTIPLYWGNQLINNEFNNNMFINWYDYNNDEYMIEKIIELDNNKEKYMEYLNGIVFKPDYINSMFERFYQVLETKLHF